MTDGPKVCISNRWTTSFDSSFKTARKPWATQVTWATQVAESYQTNKKVKNLPSQHKKHENLGSHPSPASKSWVDILGTGWLKLRTGKSNKRTNKINQQWKSMENPNLAFFPPKKNCKHKTCKTHFKSRRAKSQEPAVAPRVQLCRCVFRPLPHVFVFDFLCRM